VFSTDSGEESSSIGENASLKVVLVFILRRDDVASCLAAIRESSPDALCHRIVAALAITPSLRSLDRREGYVPVVVLTSRLPVPVG
jgi:hypothetical protein